ncbi:MAG TPA: hypothetical protein VFJ30_19080 [Phycisphaerae bacterium]|nr:hypothetical protein [Phycisphaerae bacterium]
MTRRIDLNDGWKVTWAEFQGGRPKPAYERAPAPIDATVPGSVHQDLMREGILPDPFVGDNTDHCLWVEMKDWWYSRRFDTPADLDARKALLVFHGLDTYAYVWLNGQLVGKTDNMYLRQEFDVTALLRDGQPNDLVIRFAATMHTIEVDPSHEPIAWSPQRLFARKPAMSFGWDIAPRLVTVGIWRPVELVLVDSARITNVHVTHDAPGAAGDVKARVEVEVEWVGEGAGKVGVAGRVNDAKWQADADVAPGANVVGLDLLLKDPPRWNPIGYGTPALCDVEVALSTDGREVDRHESRIGIRSIELIEQPQPSGATSFRFRCNGRDMLITGLNWTPLDAIFPRVTDAKVTAALEALAGIGCNMLRIWGGGIYESPHFYRECDRLGILIWQDFMMACGWYPQTDRYAAIFEEEGRQIVRDLRGHPCIALWAGDNENDAFYPRLMSANRLTRQVLAGVCAECDPSRPYLPSSPYSPADPDPQCQTEGDMHWYDHGRSYRDARSWDIRCRFMSEFGHLSLPSMEVIGKYFPPGTEWPVTNRMWRHHAADTIHIPRFRGAERILAALAACGKPEPETIEEAVEASQELQAEAVCAWIERYCEDPEFGGFLLWNVADCWPQQSDSVIDYLGNRKAVFDRLGPLFERMRKQDSLRKSREV